MQSAPILPLLILLLLEAASSSFTNTT
jgi:carboxypeptidase C (cathepsin A)